SPPTLSGFMTLSLLALSLSDSFTKVGAIAAFAALVGIAILSLLFFSQARELKRLREWAGRAPERAAELEQRVSTAAAARGPARVRARPATQQVRPVPRPAPVNARRITEAPSPAMGAANPSSASPPGANPATASAAAPNPAGATPSAPNPSGATPAAPNPSGA